MTTLYTLSIRPLLRAAALSSALVCVAAAPAGGNELLADFEARTTVHVLSNGWTFLIVERPVAPVFSFATVVDVGGAQEVPGITGLAHMFEHIAFKGTIHIGTDDPEAEAKALAEVEDAYAAYDLARRTRGTDPEEVERLRAAFEEKQEKAAAFSSTSEFGDVVEREGGVGLNAFTNADHTVYGYSFPANRLELFAFLESERFLYPVFREFYTERSVVQEERRLRTESRALGRLMEQMLSTAFVAHTYKQPTVGYMSDLQSFSATDARAFFERYYTASNMVTAIVGHVDPETVEPLLETYFGRKPKAPKPPPLRTVEPPQIAEKTVVHRDPSQPVYIEGYHRPSIVDDDEAVYSAIDDILTNGRASRLYRALVRDQQIAVFVGSDSGFPGSKYPGLWLLFAFPAKDRSNEEVQTALRAELERLTVEPVSDGELERFRTRAKADLLRQVRSNFGLAIQFATYHTLFGDWREYFRAIDRIDGVTKEDVMRVARKTFTALNRTVGMVATEAPAGAPPADAAESGP